MQHDSLAEPSKPCLSMIVCTRNRAARLPAMFQSICDNAKSTDFELVVVDNGSTDSTRSMLENYRTKVPFPMTIAHEPDAGLGIARNCGIAAAKSDLLFFSDDDCYPHANFVSDIVDRFREKTSLGFLGGRVLLFDPTDFPITIQLSEQKRLFQPNDCILPGEVHGANFSFRRAALVDVGCFDPRFGAGKRFCGEDIDALVRVLAAGWSGSYDPSIVVSHHHGRKTSEEAKKLRKVYARGRGALFAKCMLSPAIRFRYLKQWYWALRGQSFSVCATEVAAALDYWWLRLRERLLARFGMR